MKFLFVTYRWGRDLTGGAEIHHRRLVDDLIQLGHTVEVWTTTGRDIPAVAHWGVDWQQGFLEGEEVDEQGVIVRRFPLDRTPRMLVGLSAKYMERRLNDVPFSPELLSQLLQAEFQRLERMDEGANVFLWSGWHHPEIDAMGISRWSKPTAEIALQLTGLEKKSLELCLKGTTPEKKKLRAFCGEKLLNCEIVNGDFNFSIPLQEITDSTAVIRIETAAFRPLKDHRTLGVFVRGVTLGRKPETIGQSISVQPITSANLSEDFRAVGRRHFDLWIECLLNRADKFTPHMCSMFDWLRGPRNKALKRGLETIPQDVDFVVACNFPWSVIPMVAQVCKAPWAAMALWHLEDEYYAWPHYLQALKKARFVLANTPYSSQAFFEKQGIIAPFIGPGIPPLKQIEKQSESPTLKNTSEENTSFNVLTVCRKSGEKRYDLVIEAVDLLRDKGLGVDFTLIGPDADGLPVPEWVNYLGRVNDDELASAYEKCNVFVLLSETESFGMVVAEAWLYGKPVIVNRHCGPIASLVNEGENGFTVRTAQECAQRIEALINNPDLAKALGANGRDKTEKNYLQRSATERFLAAVEQHR
ncbi:MAG: glycosyltransferase family 4 protein [Sumerlaeia bacterium]